MADELIPPSYDKVVKSIKKSGDVAKKESKKQLEWAMQVYEDSQAMNLDIIGDLDTIRASGMASADADRRRLESVYYPLEEEQLAEINAYQQRATDFDAEVDQMKAEAIQYKSEANQQYMAGKEVAKVGQTFAAERTAAERALTDMGVNPSSGASASLSAGLRLAEGAAQAAAGTAAADATRKEGEEMLQKAYDRELQAAELAKSGLDLQKGMVDIGRTYPDQIIAEGEQARAAGAQAVDQTNAIANQYTTSAALGADWARVQNDTNQLWTDALNTGFTNELSVEELALKEQELEQEAEATESSGIGSALGAIAGIAKGFIPGLAKGGVVPGFEFGGVNDPNVSGTGGSTGNWSPTGTMSAASQAQPGTDNVPARLTAGEFVIPKHVVDWHGQKYFQNLIDKAPKEKKSMVASTGAVPTMRPAGQGALPV